MLCKTQLNGTFCSAHISQNLVNLDDFLGNIVAFSLEINNWNSSPPVVEYSSLNCWLSYVFWERLHCLQSVASKAGKNIFAKIFFLVSLNMLPWTKYTYDFYLLMQNVILVTTQASHSSVSFFICTNSNKRATF